MDVREKLVELLEVDLSGSDGYEPELIADYLLDQGVTVQENMEISNELLKQLKKAPITTWKEEPSIELVQEWISVKDRLPEADVAVLARCFYHESWRTLVCYTSKRNAGEWYTNAVGQWVQVTHWMPLPEPPKGE